MNALRPSHNMRLTQNAQGQMLSATKPGPWRHPWFTAPQWLPLKKAWVAFVLAGCVNGRAPMVRTTVGDLREAKGTFWGQLIDARAGSAEIEQAARLASSDDDYEGLDGATRIDVPLYNRPPIGLNSWTAVGFDGTGRPPKFFADLGAANPQPSGINTTTGEVKMTAPPRNLRLLRRCDVWLQQPRAALTSDIALSPVGTGSIATQTLGMRAPTDERLLIQTGDYQSSEVPDLNFRNATHLVDNYEEKTWDAQKISTVWLLSPPNTPPGSAPDSRWVSYVEHTLFWNLSWHQPLLRDVVFNEDIFRPALGILSMLGGGSTFLWASTVTSSINDAMQGAYNLLTAASLAGSFWVPTGSGSTSQWPEAKPKAPSTTLDKSQNTRARQRKAMASRLDPDFPFRGMPFNRSLLS